MATNYTAWIEDHAYHYEREQAALARAAVARDIATLREEWDTYERIYGATDAERAEIDLAFLELETLGYESGELNRFDEAWGAIDEKIHALTCAAFERNANPVALAVDSWLDAQRARFAAAA